MKYSPFMYKRIGKYQWEITKEFRFAVKQDGFFIFVKVPAGTITDGYTIPKWLWWLLPPDCLDLRPAVIHDEMVKQGWWDSTVAHAIFKANVEDLKEGPKWKKFLVKYGPHTQVLT